MDGVTIATITLARQLAEERAIITALTVLKSFPLISADGGSRPRFIASLHKLGAQLVCPKAKGLVPQVKASLRAALDASDAPHILYTEPDKLPFFEKPLTRFLEEARANKSAALTLASRNSRAFATFPEGQRRAERFMNESTEVVLGTKADYCYGPILLSRAAAALALGAPDHLGWGWRFWLLGRAAQKKLKFTAIELPVPCPVGQRDENRKQDQVYRIKQLRQNLDGLFLGLENT